MRPLKPSEVIRIKFESFEARAQARDLLHESKRLLQEYRQTVERSRQLLEKSHELIARAKLDRWRLSVVIFQAGSAAHAFSLGL